MYCTRKLTEQAVWVGGSDRRLSLFENLFPVPRGVSYNSYMIVDEKTAVLDTADSAISRQFLENVLHTLNGRDLDYLVINHMEPDHCANIEALALRFPKMKLVGMDGNIFSILGRASRLLKENGQPEQAKEMSNRVYQSGDYYKALNIISEYVETELSEKTPPKKKKRSDPER